MTINYELLSEKPMEEILNESKINYDSIVKYCNNNGIRIIEITEKPKNPFTIKKDVQSFDDFVEWCANSKPKCVSIFERINNNRHIGFELYCFHEFGLFLLDFGLARFFRYSDTGTTSVSINYINEIDDVTDEEWDSRQELARLIANSGLITEETKLKEGVKIAKQLCTEELKSEIGNGGYESAFEAAIEILNDNKIQGMVDLLRDNKEVLQGKNYNKRVALAKKLLPYDKQQNFSENELNNIVQLAKDHFEMFVLEEMACDLFKEGNSISKIAEIIGVSSKRIKSILDTYTS